MDRTELTDLILTNPTLDDIPTAQLLEFYNAYQDRPLKAFRNRAQAEERVLDLITEIEGGGSDEDPAEPTVLDEIVAEATQEQSLLASLVTQVITEPQPETELELVSLASICARLQIIPRIARRRLRKARGILTEGRWEFTQEQVAEVESILTGSTSSGE